MVLQGEFAKPFGIVKFSREATNFAAGKIASTFERARPCATCTAASSLVSSSRAVAHSCRRDQPARIQRIPVRRCRRPACAVADASETMPPKNPVFRGPVDNPSACYAGHQRGPAGPFSLRNVHRTFLRALEPPYTGEALGATSSVICLRKCHLPLKGKAFSGGTTPEEVLASPP